MKNKELEQKINELEFEIDQQGLAIRILENQVRDLTRPTKIDKVKQKLATTKKYIPKLVWTN